jgi:hypothetical protein
MSENPGEGWWVASDGQWYPPELHPSVNDDQVEMPALVPALAATEPLSAEEQASRAAHPSAAKVGPQFPDLFLKAMEGNHLADNMSVVYDGDDERNSRQTVPSTMPRMVTPAAVPSADGAPAGGAAAVGAYFGAAAPKRRWRRH